MKGKYDLNNPDSKNNVAVDESHDDRLDGDGDETERGNWSSPFDFFLSCLGYAVGLGNVWRFPYLCYKNGGGAFLIPYALMLAFAGLPLFFMELALGQYSSLGPNVVFREMIPIFQGLGYGMLTITTLVVLYYNMIIAWTIFYTFASFTSVLPWSNCNNYWNSDNCITVGETKDCISKNMTFWNKTCVEPDGFCDSFANLTSYNTTHCLNQTALGLNSTMYTYVPLVRATMRVSASEDYYRNYVLEISDGIDNLGPLSWKLVLCLLAAWVIVCLCLIKGVKSSGKVVYFTALFPYAVLFILLIRGATLPGALQGIKFYIIPKFHELKKAQVWGDAAVQIFYSLGPAWGGLITLSSYNKFKNNCYRDAVLIAIGNCATSVFAGFVIFSILGFMAHTQGVDVPDVVKSSQALAFIAYPEAVTQLPVSPLWAFLFFFMLITLGLDSQFTMVETVTTALFDQFPVLRAKKPYVVVAACFLGFVLGLSMCTRGGVYIFNLIDWYAGAWSLLFIGVIECVAVIWVYGYDKFTGNIEEMIGFRPNIFWKVTWKFVTPVLMVLILFFNWYKYTPATYGTYIYPMWAQSLGWMMALVSVLMIPGFAIYQLFKAKQKGMDWRCLLKPTADWAPGHVREKSNKTNKVVPEVNGKVKEVNGAHINPAFTSVEYESHM
ncbi:SLC6A7 (predicted) [Pycnogonum litorale]